MNRRRTAVLTLFLLSPFLWGETWTCAVTAFTGTLEEENRFLYRQIPLQIYHLISSYPEHIPSPEELLLEQEEERESNRREFVDEWEELIGQRDSLLFTDDPLGYGSLDKKIKKAKEEYSLGGAPDEKIPSARPLVFLTPGEGGILFNSEESAREKEPDLLITGTLDDAGDFILIELTGISAGSEEGATLWVGAGKTDELERMTGEIADALKGILLGREWSALAVTAEPARAQIFLNGVSLGVGSVEEEILSPGPALLEVRYPRHRIYREEILLEPGERLRRVVSLEQGKEELVTVETEPAGADVILGSVYRGKTPLVLSRPMVPEKMILSLDGYDTLATDLGPDDPGAVRYFLTAGGVDWEEERLASKDRFYNSLGWFSLSLAGPILLNGIMENQIVLANQAASYGDQDAYDEAYGKAYLSSGLFWGSMAVSGALLGVSITRLVQYIKASEKSIEQR